MQNARNGNYIIQWIVVLADFLLMNILVLVFLHLNLAFVPDGLTENPRMYFLISNVAMIIAEFFFHTIIHARILYFWQVLRRVFGLAIVQTAVAYAMQSFIEEHDGLFVYSVYYFVSLYVILLLSRTLERRALESYREKGGNTRAVIFVGSDPANLAMYKELTQDPATGYNILGYYSNDIIEDGPEELRKLGTLNDLAKLISPDNKGRRICDEMFVSLSHSDYERIVKLIKFCDANVIHFYYVPRQFGNYRLQLKSELIGNIEVMTNLKEPLLDPTNKFIKRAFDIVLSFFVCLIIAIFYPIIALIIKIQSPGPVLFKQKRTGLNGKTFVCYKFRSMHINSESDMEQATLDDPRKFPFGSFMRKCNIDEFPQFFNVLKGDMSIVGPRPHMLHHTDIYSKLIDKYMVRHFSKPGITGWAQVTGYRGETKELWQMEERVRRDIWYIENWSFWLDIKIILMTAVSLFKPDEKAY